MSEVYKVLTTTGEVYFPSIDQINLDFIMDLLWGDKLVSSLSYSEVHRVKQGQDYRGSSYQRNENLWDIRVGKQAQKD